jgi:hypothetical protein
MNPQQVCALRNTRARLQKQTSHHGWRILQLCEGRSLNYHAGLQCRLGRVSTFRALTQKPEVHSPLLHTVLLRGSALLKI